jgi:hypothetical protein
LNNPCFEVILRNFSTEVYCMYTSLLRVARTRSTQDPSQARDDAEIRVEISI